MRDLLNILNESVLTDDIRVPFGKRTTPPAPAAAPPAPLTPERKSEIKAQGYEAARLGAEAKDNPHPKGSQEAHLWEVGAQDYFFREGEETDEEPLNEEDKSQEWASMLERMGLGHLAQDPNVLKAMQAAYDWGVEETSPYPENGCG